MSDETNQGKPLPEMIQVLLDWKRLAETGRQRRRDLEEAQKAAGQVESEVAVKAA